MLSNVNLTSLQGPAHFYSLFSSFKGQEVTTTETTATLRTLITSKLDRLDQKLSIVLKFAVVIGRVFLVSILNSLLPDIPMDTLRAYLNELGMFLFV